MINRVILAGRVIQTPVTEQTGNGRTLTVFELEVTHPRWGEAIPECCTVRVLCAHEARGEVLRRFCEAGRSLAVTGALVEEAHGLSVNLEGFEFLGRDIKTRYLRHEAWALNDAA